MSLLAPKNVWYSLAGLLVGGLVGFLVGRGVEGGDLLWPITLAGAIVGMLLGGLVRTVLRR